MPDESRKIETEDSTPVQISEEQKRRAEDAPVSAQPITEAVDGEGRQLLND
jgi:hypothetical protein